MITHDGATPLLSTRCVHAGEELDAQGTGPGRGAFGRSLDYRRDLGPGRREAGVGFWTLKRIRRGRLRAGPRRARPSRRCPDGLGGRGHRAPSGRSPRRGFQVGGRSTLVRRLPSSAR
jgi:hypothetical protein